MPLVEKRADEQHGTVFRGPLIVAKPAGRPIKDPQERGASLLVEDNGNGKNEGGGKPTDNGRNQ